ncbi:MAG: hypothetical protein WCV67_21610, partial [Victivallaceae bacterium]
MNLPLISPEMINFILGCLGALAAVGVTFYLSFYKFKNPKTRKRRIIFVLSLAGLVVAYLLFYTVSNQIGRYQAEKQLARMEARGISTTLKGIKPALPGKSSGNGVQYYEAAKALMKCSSYETLNNRYMSYDNHRVAYTTYDVARWDKADQPAALQLLSNKEIDMIFDLFHQGAQQPVAVYDRDYSRGFATMMPELNTQRALFRLLNMKTSALGLEGKPAAGYALIRDGFKAVKQFETDPTLISQLVNIACISIDIEAMNSLLARYGIDDQSARQLLETLAQLDIGRGMLHAMNGEVMLTSDFFEGIMTGKSDYEKEKWLCSRDKLWGMEYGRFPVKQVMQVISWPFIYWDYNYYLDYMQKCRTLFMESYWQAADKIKTLKIEEPNIPYRYPVSKMMLPALVSARTKVARIESEIDAAKLTLALHIYKNQNGTFPDSLEQLAPGILKAIPVDPVSGKPF